MFVPSSIPSPSDEWQAILLPLGSWLSGLGVSPDYVVPIRAYALCILAGIVAATILTGRRLKRRGADPGVVLDIALWSVPFGIVGGRIFHVVTHPDDYFGAGRDLARVLYVWEGGLAIFGALIFGALGTYIGCRLAGVRFWSFADALVPGLLLAQAFGRLGNWFNQELFGLPTDGWWGLEIERPNDAIPVGLAEDTLFLPTFLFEIVWNLIGVAALLLAERRFARVPRESGDASDRRLAAVGWRLQWGRLLGLYLVWYGTGRMVFESIRIDPSEILLGIRTNVWAAFAAVVIGFVIIIVQGRRHPGIEPGPYEPGREWKPDAEVDSDDTYSASDNDDDDRNHDDGDGAGSEDASPAASRPATSGVRTRA